MQFSRFNLKGKRVPIWTREQGVGRAFTPSGIYAACAHGARGSWHTTYAPLPLFITSSWWWCSVESNAYIVLDFRHPRRITIEIYDDSATIYFQQARSYQDAVSTLSAALHRQPPLPNWVWNGMWIGVQGGSEVVAHKLETARLYNMRVGAVWAQDWCGTRATAFGQQVMWDWRADNRRYPALKEMISELREEEVNFLGYINPFVAMDSALYREVEGRDFFVRTKGGHPYPIEVTTFAAALVDLTNPDALRWYRELILREMIALGMRGWMADFGEYLPSDCLLFDGADPFLYHNRYPAEWAALNRAAIAQSGRGDLIFFMRAAGVGAARHVPLYWAGDKNVDWSYHDGYPSTVDAALSAGASGTGALHSDIGGYTALGWKRRTKETLMRWADYALFSPIMRTHEGNRPAINHQYDSDVETLGHFARLSNLHALLAPYHRHTHEEYQRYGLPAMRPVALHYPGYGLPHHSARPTSSGAARGNISKRRAYMYGRDIIVVTPPRAASRRVTIHLPDDEWCHLWSGRKYDGGSYEIATPIGYPAAFYRNASDFGALFQELAGYRYTARSCDHIHQRTAKPQR